MPCSLQQDVIPQHCKSCERAERQVTVSSASDSSDSSGNFEVIDESKRLPTRPEGTQPRNSQLPINLHASNTFVILHGLFSCEECQIAALIRALEHLTAAR